MTSYQGLNDGLRTLVRTRDRHRCRWCGATNQSTDIHHVRYRRGSSDDVPENLILLCRMCHGFVHGNKAPNGDTITKAEAQEILFMLIELPGATGAALRRQIKRREEQGQITRLGDHFE